MMKRFFTTGLLSVALSASMSSGVGAATDTDEAKSALATLENKWVDAIVKRDTAALNSILANTYVDTAETGERSNKQGVLSFVRSANVKMKSITLSAMRVYLYGDAAVVTGNAEQIGTYKGAPVARNIRFTDSFMKLHGRWQAVASARVRR